MGAGPQLSSNFSSLDCMYLGLSSPHLSLALEPQWRPGLWENRTLTSHRFRQVRLKHRKLREQVNSMVDISKVPGSYGSRGGGWAHGQGNLALE